MNNKNIYIFSWTVIIVGALMIVLFAWLLFFEGNPPVEVTSPGIIDKGEYYQGENIYMTFEYCRYVDVPAIIFSSFVDSKSNYSYSIPPIITNAQSGCGVITVDDVIPHDLPPGRYMRVSKGLYQVNAFADRTALWYTEEFDVLERK